MAAQVDFRQPDAVAEEMTDGANWGLLLRRSAVRGRGRDPDARALPVSDCQKISGGAGNLFIGLEADGFRYTHGEPAHFARPEVADAPTREFCATCGVHLAARSPRAAGGVIVTVGALDAPSAFEGPGFVVWTEEKQAFHQLPEGVPAFPRFPGRS